MKKEMTYIEGFDKLKKIYWWGKARLLASTILCAILDICFSVRETMLGNHGWATAWAVLFLAVTLRYPYLKKMIRALHYDSLKELRMVEYNIEEYIRLHPEKVKQ